MRFPGIKQSHIFMAFGFGAISTLVASWASMGMMLDAFPVLLPFSFEGMSPLMILMAVIVAPFAEELAKPIGMYILNSEEAPDLELGEWALLGAIAGLGFAVVENFLYAASMLAYGTEASLWLLGLRFLLPLHMVATAISVFGFGLWTKTGRPKYFAVCMFAAMLLHGLYNLAATVVG